MTSYIKFIVSSVIFCLAVPAFSQSEWRTQVQVSVGSGTTTQIATDGGLNVAFSERMLTTITGSANSQAEAGLNGGGYIPTLRARAVSSGTRAQAVAWGVQAYTNTSAGPVATSLILQLNANVTGGNDVEARVYLFQDENFEFYADPGTMLFESSSQLWPGFEPYANNLGPDGFDIDITGATGTVSEMRQFDFTVGAGDSFYVWARLVATADQSGEVDAFNTLTASLTNTNGLTPAGSISSGVPAGRISGDGISALRVQLVPGGDVALSWGPSCAATDDDYGVYEGILGRFTSHTPVTCSTEGTTSFTFGPATGNSYFLVVPNNPSNEGSHGLVGTGAERPVGASSCATRLVDSCP